MFCINLENACVGLYVSSDCFINFKARKCHFSPSVVFKIATCLFLVKLCLDM